MTTSEEIHFRVLRSCEFGLDIDSLWTSHVDLPPVITRLTANNPEQTSYNISDVMASIWDNLVSVWYYNDTSSKWMRYIHPDHTTMDWNYTRAIWLAQGKWTDVMFNEGQQYWVRVEQVPDRICF